jgi:hypothetical protein
MDKQRGSQSFPQKLRRDCGAFGFSIWNVISRIKNESVSCHHLPFHRQFHQRMAPKIRTSSVLRTSSNNRHEEMLKMVHCVSRLRDSPNQHHEENCSALFWAGYCLDSTAHPNSRQLQTQILCLSLRRPTQGRCFLRYFGQNMSFRKVYVATTAISRLSLRIGLARPKVTGGSNVPQGCAFR